MLPKTALVVIGAAAAKVRCVCLPSAAARDAIYLAKMGPPGSEIGQQGRLLPHTVPIWQRWALLNQIRFTEAVFCQEDPESGKKAPFWSESRSREALFATSAYPHCLTRISIQDSLIVAFDRRGASFKPLAPMANVRRSEYGLVQAR